MPEVRYGGEGGKAVRLEVDPELVAVRVRRVAPCERDPSRARSRRCLTTWSPC